jgi:hypothetical protein
MPKDAEGSRSLGRAPHVSQRRPLRRRLWSGGGGRCSGADLPVLCVWRLGFPGKTEERQADDPDADGAASEARYLEGLEAG